MTVERAMRAIAAVAAMVLTATVAVAVEPVGRLVTIDGTALVSKGGLYAPGSDGLAIRLGDRLMVLEGGRAAIWYGDTCEYFLLDDEVLDVTAASPCASGLGGQFRPEIAETNVSTDDLRLRLAQVGGDASAGSLETTAEVGLEDLALEAAAETELAGAAGASTSSGFALTGSVTLAGTTMTTGTLIGLTSALALGALGLTEGSGGTIREEEPISEIR